MANRDTPADSSVAKRRSFMGVPESSAAGRILIIEDDRPTAEALELYLRDAGFDTRIAHDGVTGLHEAEEGRYDLVLLDLMLPGMYGMDVCKRVRERSTVPIVMLTARALEDDQIRGLELGADDYIMKPFSPRQVVARIRSVLRRHRGGATSFASGPPCLMSKR
jgi:DNA-binding response OmpR family regulator